MPLLGTLGEGSSRSYGLYGNTGVGGRVVIPLTIAANTYNYDVYTNRGPTYIAGASDITVTVAAPATVGSTATPTYALLVPSAFSPTDTITIVNNGVIQGMGGGGGPANSGPFSPFGTAYPGSAGATGGNAIYVNRPTTITNNGVVASGGGGGGGGASNLSVSARKFGGGGGGGAGLNGGAGGSGLSAPGVPSSGSGSPGTSPAGGAGGPGNFTPIGGGGAGGAGGGRGAAGSSGSPTAPTGSGGGGGATGNYIVGNPFVTWPVTGTRQGNVA
jgi:hypothetical protein